MSENIPINHHYVPQFLLRNFACDKDIIYIYRSKDQGYVKRNIRYNFNKDNLYKDIAEEDVMIVEKLFAELEHDVAEITNKVLVAKNQIVLNRIEVEAIKRFLYLMEFRSKRRKKQYEDENFDPLTRLTLDEKTDDGDYVKLWLNELKTLLQHTKYTLNPNELSQPIAMDFDYYMNGTFITIWDACEDERFIITDNFGTFEMSQKYKPLKLFLLFPISPRRMIALSNIIFMKPDSFRGLDTKFTRDMVEFPKNTRVSKYHDSDEDQYKYPVKRIRNREVMYANELLLNEFYEIFTFNDPKSITRSIEQFQSYPEGYTKNIINQFVSLDK